MAAPADEAVEKWLPEETSTKFEESRVGKVFKAVTDLDKTNRNAKMAIQPIASEEF
jgi:phosphoribosylformylglycinamidine (FGAM) synthase PurS component